MWVCGYVCSVWNKREKKEKLSSFFFSILARTSPVPDRYASAHRPCSYVQERLQGLRPAGVTGSEEEEEETAGGGGGGGG